MVAERITFLGVALACRQTRRHLPVTMNKYVACLFLLWENDALEVFEALLQLCMEPVELMVNQLAMQG